jgi:acyl carrier protein
MSPLSFLKRPCRWLEAISTYGGTHSAAPNFAFELCIREIDAEERRRLDLHTWRMAMNGAEPVRADTLRRFAETFAPCGFDPRALTPAYGLAEATLKVTSGRAEEPTTILAFDAKALEEGRVVESAADGKEPRELVGCGGSEIGTEIRIVDPETRRPCLPDRIGEIWLAGDTVALGFWNRPEETRETFHAALAEDDGKRYLRTGDLGFLHGGELFVTGRLKELIIIRGANYYPQDVEKTVEDTHPALRPHGGAAFSVEADGEEKLVVVQEEVRRAARDLDVAKLFARIRQAVSEEHGLAVHAIVLVRQGSVGKTSSGKLQRRLCRAQFLAGELETVAAWREPGAPLVPDTLPVPADILPDTPADASSQADRRRRGRHLEDRLLHLAARSLAVAPEEIGRDQPLSRYGMSSATALALVGAIEKALGRELPSTLLWEYPTIAALAAHLGGEVPPVSPVSAAVPAPRFSRGRAGDEPVAIVGLGLCLPGADDPEAFWRLLDRGTDAIRQMPGERCAVIPAIPARGPLAWG